MTLSKPILGNLLCLSLAGLALRSVQAADLNHDAVMLGWLDGAPPSSRIGVSWGVPWPQGKVLKDATFSLADADGKQLPLQSWPLAYWPDGSLKWTGFAAPAAPEMRGPLTLTRGSSVAPGPIIKSEETADFIEIDTGKVKYRLSKHGQHLVDSIAMDGRVVGEHGDLVCVLEDRSDYDTKHATREVEFVSRIKSAVIEQTGPVRAVVKIEGEHWSETANRAWLPFTVRLYFFAGVDTVRMVHSFVFDGDQEKDFIRGLGIRFMVPMRMQAHNRQVRLAGETGLFAEPVRVIAGRRNASPDLYKKQVAGEPIPNLEDLPNKENVEMMAVWDDYKLVQISSDSYSIQKRTNPKSCWINATAGRRALGLAFVGDTRGGLALGLKNFWQLAPTELEIHKASTDMAELTLWLWSPDSPAMDLRHYDIKEHGLEASYEDIEPGFSTATGVARTTELVLRPFAEVPTNDELLDLARVNVQPPHLVCTPEYYHSIPVFGVWSLPDRSTQRKQWIEDGLDQAIAFYQGQIEQRRWYGFWDYGDVMHTYDDERHEWRYDIGGYAWANTELMPDLWLWYSFLRTGRADIFRMAEAMTRQTQEVDVYHLGRFAGLGSRHNVRHWGCGAKEARISQAVLKRFYYYLTTDERVGDLMNEVVDADYKLLEVDPLRKIEADKKYPTHARIGPDWFAFCGNWLAAWERTGDTRRRDKIFTGMKCIAAMPRKLFSGGNYGYDPKTGLLYQLHDNVDIPHLAALMGGPELMMELTPLVNRSDWNEAWLQYCRYLQAPADEQRKALGGTITTGRGPMFARLTAYAAFVDKDPVLAARAWKEFLGRDTGQPRFVWQRIDNSGVPAPVDEIRRISTNETSQWCLNAIELLELVGNYLPATVPTKAEKP
ncbi:MAG TPA: hypothetical protein VLZ30_12230 [Verrucomicrobiae bacterium]|nr:hypothetical protein [Verrucomicrobiae bacterium]